jgi:hypothetical protein
MCLLIVVCVHVGGRGVPSPPPRFRVLRLVLLIGGFFRVLLAAVGGGGVRGCLGSWPRRSLRVLVQGHQVTLNYMFRVVTFV